MTRHAPHPADLKPGPRTGYDLEDLAPAPRPAADDAGPAPGRVPAPFARDRFLLRQKLVAINQKYFVQDEDG
ncbi:MAG TPA: hypothetical protein VD963_01725, partial [Phycisphaerales bacterium]|nr:hypothetical protein [Phycisphaerales bacterium]